MSFVFYYLLQAERKRNEKLMLYMFAIIVMLTG